MQQRTIQHKQTSKSWVNAESLLQYKRTSSQYVTIPATDGRYDFGLTNSWSVSTVWKASDVNLNNGVPIMGRMYSDSGSNNQGWQLDVWDYSATDLYKQVRFLYATGSGFYEKFMFQPILNTIYHIVVTFNPSVGFRAYINGLPLSAFADSTPTLSPANPTYNDAPLTIGACRYANSLRQGNGAAAFTSVYNKTLNQVEVSQLYDQVGIVPKSLHANCVGFWTMQERYGNKCYDSVDSFNYAKMQYVVNPTIDTNITGYIDESWNAVSSSLFWEGGKAVMTATSAMELRMNVVLQSGKQAGWYQLRCKGRSWNNGVPLSSLHFRVHQNFDVSIPADQDVIYNFYADRDFGMFIGGGEVAGTNMRFELDYCYVYKGSAPLTPNHADLIGYTINQNLVANSNFADSSAWVVPSGNGGSISGGKFTCYNTDQVTVLYQDLPVILGRMYLVKIKHTIRSQGFQVMMDYGDFSTLRFYFDSTTSEVDIPFLAKGVNRLRITSHAGGAPNDFDIHFVEVREAAETFKLDFYTKDLNNPYKYGTDRILAEAKSGLPELKNALRTYNGTSSYYLLEMLVSNAIKSVSINNCDIVYQFYIAPDRVTTNGKRFLFIAAPNWDIEAELNRFFFFPKMDASNALVADFKDSVELLDNGFYTIVIQKVGIRDIRIYLNGRLLALRENATGKINQPYGVGVEATNYDMNLSEITRISFPNHDIQAISFGIKEGNLEPKDMIRLHNNSLLSNPTNISNWKCFVQFGSSNSLVQDLTGNGANISLSSYTTDQLNPAHTNYVIKPINSLR